MDNLNNEITIHNESQSPFKKIHFWSDGDTRKLLDLYAKYMPEIGPMKQFKNKKDMWAKISTEIKDATSKQCEERYKTVLKRKKVAVDNNGASGSKRIRIDFEEELNKICSMDDSVEPEVQISSQKCNIKSGNLKGNFSSENAGRKKLFMTHKWK